jgi:hypothetical protein
VKLLLLFTLVSCSISQNYNENKNLGHRSISSIEDFKIYKRIKSEKDLIIFNDWVVQSSEIIEFPMNAYVQIETRKPDPFSTLAETLASIEPKPPHKIHIRISAKDAIKAKMTYLEILLIYAMEKINELQMKFKPIFLLYQLFLNY